MRKILVLVLFIIQISHLYADAGLAFRYKVEIQKKSNEKITGYVYHYTYSNGYNDLNESFCDYFVRDFNNEPYLYLEIRSLKLSNEFELDFSLPINKVGFDLEDIDNINLLKEDEFIVGDKIFLIENENVYNLLENSEFNKEKVYFTWMENCSFQIVDFTKRGKLSQIKSDILKRIKLNFDDKEKVLNEKFYDYYYKERENLLKKKILVFQYCDAL